MAAERPRLFHTRFGTWLLRGEMSSTFEPDGQRTRLTEVFDTVCVIPAISAWIFAHGSDRGSFRGELQALVRIAEREAREGA